MKKIDMKSKMLKYSTCTVLGAGMICALAFGNTAPTAKEDKTAAIGVVGIDSAAKDAVKSIEQVSTKKSAKKDQEQAETKTKEKEQQEEVAQETQTQTQTQQAQEQESSTQKETAPVSKQTSAPKQQEAAPQPATENITSPIAQTALSLVGSQMYCEEVAEASINAVGRSAWITKTYMDGDVQVVEDTMGPDNFLQIASQVSLNNLQPGDLLWYANNGGGGSHIAVYVGNNQAVHGGYNGRNVVLAGIYLPGASTPIGLRV